MTFSTLSFIFLFLPVSLLVYHLIPAEKSIWRKVALLIPLIYLLPRLISDQTLAVFLAEPVADTLAVIFTAILFAVKFKKLPA